MIAEVIPLHILQWLGSLACHGLRMKPLKKASRVVMADVIDLAHAGAVVVAGWPRTFFDVLEVCRADTARCGELDLLNEALPGLSKLIKKLRDGAWKARIVSVLGSYVTSSLQTVTPISGRNAPGACQTTLSSVARQLGMRTERLIASLDFLPPTAVAMRTTAGGRLRRAISAEVVAKVRDAVRDEISVKQAARLIGLTVARVKHLVDGGRLCVAGNRLSRKGVDDFRRSVLAAGSGGVPPSDAIELRQALRYFVPVDHTDRLIASICARDLSVYRPPSARLPAQLLVREAQIKTWAARQLGNGHEWLTIPVCAEQLGLKQEVVYHR